MSKEIIQLSKNSVKLCCSGNGCCPTITDLGDGTVKITDDDGNTVIMKKEEAVLVSDGVKTLDEQRLILG